MYTRKLKKYMGSYFITKLYTATLSQVGSGTGMSCFDRTFVIKVGNIIRFDNL